MNVSHPGPIPHWGTALLIFAGVVILELPLLMAVKLVLLWLDHKEAEKLRKEKEKRKALSKKMNPVYQPPPDSESDD